MIEADENVAYRTVVKRDADGKQWVDIEPFTCDDKGHVYSPVVKRGPRAGFPKMGAYCICRETRYTEQMEREILLGMEQAANAAINPG